MAGTQRAMRPMSREQALGKLGSVPYGRIVFTQHSLPALRLVSHLMDRGQIVIRTHEGAAIAGATGSGAGTVVAYEADQVDPASGAAWSTVVTGVARLVDDRQRAAAYRQALDPWAGGDVNDVIICIDPQFVAGCQNAGASAAAAP